MRIERRRDEGGGGEEREGEKEYVNDTLTETIIGCIIRVHRELGPGFMEKVYRNAILIELTKAGLAVEAEKEIILRYDGQEVGWHRLDLVIEGRVIVELKTVDELSRAHYAQVRSYLRSTGLEVALLVNLSKERSDCRRVRPI